MGTSEKAAHFTLTGDVALEVLTACEMELKVRLGRVCSAPVPHTAYTQDDWCDAVKTSPVRHIAAACYTITMQWIVPTDLRSTGLLHYFTL